MRNAERRRVLRLREARLEPFLRPHRHVLVPSADQVVERAVERLVDQAREEIDGIGAAFERDGLSVGKAHALDRIDALAQRALMRLRGALTRAEHARPRGEPEIAELVGERRGARELDLPLRDERAAVPAFAPDQEAFTFELAERLAEGHPADAEALSKDALRRQPGAGRELPALDRVLESGLDLSMGGAAARLDGSFRERHYGLDFSMPTEALVLALSAAVIHAVWNLLLAGARDSQAFAAVVLIVAALVGAPAAVFFWDFHAAVWPFLLATSVLELTYFALLAYAYTRSELSVVYPLARGLAPVLVLAAAVAFTGAGTNGRQIGGVLLVGAGILLVRGIRGGRGALLAVLIACAIAAYTIVDKHGVTHASPVAYLELMSIFTGVAYAAFIVATRGPGAPRRRRLRRSSCTSG